MTNLCRRCFGSLKDGQKASCVVTATYHSLKSAVAYALDKSDMIADPDTLVHAFEKDCRYEDDYKV